MELDRWASGSDALTVSTAISGEQHSVLVGLLLGDGAMRCKRNALFEVNHCFAQRRYVEWKYELLRNLVRTPPKLRSSNGNRLAFRFTTLSLPALTPYYRAFYQNGHKIVPDIALSPLALATWFMDDGCKSRRTVYLNTQQFDICGQLNAIEMLERCFGIGASLNRDKAYFGIRIAGRSISRFLEIVRPYIIPEMQYKLPGAGAMSKASQALIQ